MIIIKLRIVYNCNIHQYNSIFLLSFVAFDRYQLTNQSKCFKIAFRFSLFVVSLVQRELSPLQFWFFTNNEITLLRLFFCCHDLLHFFVSQNHRQCWEQVEMVRERGNNFLITFPFYISSTTTSFFHFGDFRLLSPFLTQYAHTKSRKRICWSGCDIQQNDIRLVQINLNV